MRFFRPCYTCRRIHAYADADGGAAYWITSVEMGDSQTLELTPGCDYSECGVADQHGVALLLLHPEHIRGLNRDTTEVRVGSFVIDANRVVALL